MIIWSGLGFSVAVIAYACVLSTQLLTNAAFCDDHYYQSHTWPKLVGVWVASVLVWFLGRRLNSKPTKILLDPETGEKVVFKPNHSLFFIPMQYWGPILAVLVLVFVFQRK